MPRPKHFPADRPPIIIIQPTLSEANVTRGNVYDCFGWREGDGDRLNPRTHLWTPELCPKYHLYYNLRIKNLITFASGPAPEQPGTVSFGWQLQYVNCPEVMDSDLLYDRYSTIRRIERAIDKTKLTGYTPSTYGQYVCLIAGLENIAEIVVPKGSDYPYSRALPIGEEAINAIDALCLELHQQCLANYNAKAKQMIDELDQTPLPDPWIAHV